MQFVEVNEHEEIRQLAHDFGEKEIRPILEEYEQKEELPLDLVRKMGALGFFGIIVPEQYGGSGMDYWGLRRAIGSDGPLRLDPRNPHGAAEFGGIAHSLLWHGCAKGRILAAVGLS